MVQTRASPSTTPIRAKELGISVDIQNRDKSRLICYRVVSPLVLRIVLTLAAMSPSSRSPLVAVDTRVEHRTGEQKTIVPVHAHPRSTFVTFASVTWGLWGVFGPCVKLWGTNGCKLGTRLRPSTYRSLHLDLLD